jgi:hypothetical protein
VKALAYLPYLLGVVGVIVYGAISGLAGPKSGGVLGAIRGEDGRLSTSKFQFFLWTGVVIFVWVAIFVAQAIPGALACTTSSNPAIPANVLLAMGFSVITLATAKGVTSAYVYAGRTAKGSNNPWSWSDLVCGDDGSRPDLSKIQMLAWTIIAAASYLYTSLARVAVYTHGTSPGPPCGLPDIDPALMALMGIGQGAYLGTKIVQTATVILRSLSKPQTYAGDTVTINGSGFGNQTGSVYFGRVAAVLAADQPAWTDTAIKVVVPAIDSADNQPFKPGDTVMVGVLLAGADGTSSTGNTLPFTYAAPAAAAPAAPASAVAPASAPLPPDQAVSVVRNWLDDHMKTRAVAEGGPPADDPVLYRLIKTPTFDSPVMSVKGPVHPPAPARHAFFLDHLPRANWEHWCSYVFVDDDGNVSVVDSTAPPSAKTETQTRLQYTRPADLTS